MKNIMIVDGADNCAYDIFQTSDEGFKLIFPEAGQNIEFIEDIQNRANHHLTSSILAEMWHKPIKKEKVVGIHGLLFYELAFKKKFYPSKKDEDLDNGSRGFVSKDL